MQPCLLFPGAALLALLDCWLWRCTMHAFTLSYGVKWQVDVPDDHHGQ
jgi:hypothetical protein